MKKSRNIITLFEIAIILTPIFFSTGIVYSSYAAEPLALDGEIEIYFSPQYILGDKPSDTERNINDLKKR